MVVSASCNESQLVDQSYKFIKIYEGLSKVELRTFIHHKLSDCNPDLKNKIYSTTSISQIEELTNFIPHYVNVLCNSIITMADFENGIHRYKSLVETEIEESHQKFIEGVKDKSQIKEIFLFYVSVLDKDTRLSALNKTLIDNHLIYFEIAIDNSATLKSTSPIAKEFLMSKYSMCQLMSEDKLSLLKALVTYLSSKIKRGTKGNPYESYILLCIDIYLRKKKKIN